MSLRKKLQEIRRLIADFETEAQKYHALIFSRFFITQQGPNIDRTFLRPNHAIMLWQYYGHLSAEGDDTDQFCRNLEDSGVKWGIRGAEYTSMGVLEGEGCELFLRMAKRAGSLFSVKEAQTLKLATYDDLVSSGINSQDGAKPVFTVNDNPLAIWLNYLLFHLSKSNPGRELAERIEPDPYTLSLLALERLAENPKVTKIDRSVTDIASIHFQVALSFPGEHRTYVAEVARELRNHLGADAVFYDLDYQGQLSRPNLDTLLQDIYRNRSDLVVVFLCANYTQKEWCGLEWRSIRDIIKHREDQRIMFVRFDDTEVIGVFSIDGYIDGSATPATKVAEYALERVSLLGD